MSFYRPQFIKSWLSIVREEGIKSLLKQKGWKVVVAFILFYLVRDSILYIIIPILAINGVITCQ